MNEALFLSHFWRFEKDIQGAVDAINALNSGIWSRSLAESTVLETFLKGIEPGEHTQSF